VRIAKATKAGKYNRIKALQWLLTHSYSAKVIAVKRVTENHGKTTPGIDGVLWNTPEKKITAAKELKRRGYSAKSLRRIYIPKKNGKKRPISIPVMKDRGMEALYLQALDPVSETLADNYSYGFRKERCAADAIEKCFKNLSRKYSPVWILEADIKSCFDKISHEWLIKNVPIDKVILRKWLKAGFVEKGRIFPTEEGTPQGGIISPTLANITLDGLEKELKRKFPTHKGKKVNLVRYADDFSVTGNSKKVLEEVRPVIENFLKERGLELSQEKTRITHIEDGFDFLGENIRKYKGKLLIKPSKENFKAISSKIREVISSHKTIKQSCLIQLLNPLIRGWSNYHSGIVAKETYSKLDKIIWEKLWQWCCRRHPNKGKRWIKAKYFKQVGSRNWVFKAKTGETLLKAADTKIVRHINIKGEYNPYDPIWETYSEERTQKQMEKRLNNRDRLLKIWKMQKGKCPCCEETITAETGWNLHHIVKRMDGGTEVLSNLELLHPNCHKQLHYKNTVAGSQ
jgi:RNA-directed DNA polymerase